MSIADLSCRLLLALRSHLLTWLMRGYTLADRWVGMSRWRLARQLFVATLMIVTLSVLLSGSLLFQVERARQVSEQQQFFHATLKLIAAMSREAVQRSDHATLTRLLAEVGTRDAYLMRLTLHDSATGSTLAAWQRPTPLTGHPQPLELRLTVTDPALTVALVWDSGPLQSGIARRTVWLLMVMTLLLLALAVSLIWLVHAHVIRPINILRADLQGERAPRLALRLRACAPELRYLARTLDALLRLKGEIKRSEIRYRGLFENMISAGIVLSHQPEGFRIEAINEPCRQLPLLDLRERSVHWLHEVIAAHESPHVYTALQTVLAQGGSLHLDEFTLMRGGQTHWLDCHVFPLTAGEAMLMIRDVTDRKIARDLRHAKEAAEQASALKSAFLASMSHEIRTPLNGVLSMVELLRSSQLTDRQLHWVEAIRSSGQLLLSTINDILDFSRIEAGRLQLEKVPFSLGEVIANLFNATLQRAYAKNLECVIHQDPELPDLLVGDPFRLQQILVNLVGNAIKFTHQGEIEIRITYSELPDARLKLCVSVRDTGIGIAPEQVEMMFQPFQQIRAGGWRVSEGTGLGLAICKRLLDAMDGELGVESAPGQGSLFYFEVPVGRAEPGQQTSWLLPAAWRCPTLVWIKHDLVRATATHLLSTLGFEAEQTGEVAVAMQWAQALAPEVDTCLLVLDEAWLLHDGPRLVAELQRRSARTQRRVLTLYVVNVFAHDQGELDRLITLRDTTHVLKPLHLSALFNALQDLFDASGQRVPVMRRSDDPSWEVLIQRLEAREHLSGARLLLAEDNLVNQQVATEALAMIGIATRVVVNGEEALQALNEEAFDGVLMDLQMPVMDGLEATALIRSQYAPSELPIIAMTASVFFKDRQRSLQVGMNDHIGKPINMRNLLETLLKWIRPAHPQPFHPPASEAVSTRTEERLQLIEGELDWHTVNLPGIKPRKGLSRLGGNGLLYFRLLMSFASLQQQGAAEMRAACEREDLAALRLQAHTLKGVAKTLGADALHQWAERVEQASEAGEREDLAVLVPPMLDELTRVLGGVQQFLEHWHLHPEPVADALVCAEVDPAVAVERYALVGTLLEHGDTRLRDVCAENRALLRVWFEGNGSHGVEFERFSQLIEQYRFEEARRIFREKTCAPEVGSA